MFVDVVRSEHRATIVGEETGGAYAGNSAGEFVAITLPETQLKVVVPLEEFVMAVRGPDRKDRGVIPDIPVVPTIDDVLAGTDPELAATLAAIAKRR
jgi:C-terminal processing protease CtpA/Prc